MLAKRPDTAQLSFYTTFEEQLNHHHPLYILANTIQWNVFDEKFGKHYSPDQGTPAKPIRRMVGLILLKHPRNLSDESIVEQWAENSYYQYFCGETSFAGGKPCDASELVHFRHRIGQEGTELIFQESVRVNGKDAEETTVCVDTSVQEKNITFPTDDKLYKRIIRGCREIAEEEGVELRQSYERTVKRLSYQQRFKRSEKQQKKARKASKKIKTIAGRLVREIERKLPVSALERHSASLALFKKVLAQQRYDKHKIYSVHEPSVECIGKGKEHKKYEFGNKVSLMITRTTGVIVGALSLENNDYDGHTLEPALAQYKRFYNREPKKAITDLGYKGVTTVGATEIVTPMKKGKTPSEKYALRKDHRRRSAIEACFSHLKHSFRLGRNFYRAVVGDVVNVLLAAAACNFKRMMNKWKAEWKKFFLVLELFRFALATVLSFMGPKPLGIYQK